MDSGTYQPIIPNCMPSSYPSGRFSLIVLRTALSAARRSAGRAARYWATVEAVMLATIHGSERQKEELRFKNGATGASDIEGKAARVAASERAASEFQVLSATGAKARGSV